MHTFGRLNDSSERRFVLVMDLFASALSRLREQGVELPDRELRDADDALKRIVRARKPDAIDHAAELLCDWPGCETLTAEELARLVLELETEELGGIASELMRLAVIGERDGATPEERLAEGLRLELMAEVGELGNATPRREARAAWWAETLRDDARFRQVRVQAHALLPRAPKRGSSPRRGQRVRVGSRRSPRMSRRSLARAGPALPRRSADLAGGGR